MRKIPVITIVFALLMVIGLTGCGTIRDLIKSDPIKEMLLATPAGTLERMEATEVVLSTPMPESSDFQFYLSDDFSDPSSGWFTVTDEYGSIDYVNGTYQIEAIKEGYYNWGTAGLSLDNVKIEVDVDVLQTTSDLDDGFGVDCRIQENDDGYGFRIASDGNVEIMMFKDGESSALVDWEVNDAVYTDGRTNHITAICDGPQLSLLVNGVEVATTYDSSFTKGDIAFSALSFTSEPIVVAFDNLEVWTKEASTVSSSSGDYSLEVSNPTDFEICGLFIVPSTEEFWNDDLLGEGETIAPGESRTFTNLVDSYVDLRAETCDFFTVNEAYELDLLTTSFYELGGPRQLLHQTFDSIEGWPSGVVDGGMVSNNNGVYGVTVSEADKLVTIPSTFSGQDLILFANASMVRTGADDMGIYGVTCRMRPDGSGIFFAIRGDGMASIISVQKGVMEQLTDWTSSEYINPGAASNNIEANCLGSFYTMYVNGDYVGSVEDTSFQSGKVGVAVFSPAGSSTEADFDFLDVYAGE